MLSVFALLIGLAANARVIDGGSSFSEIRRSVYEKPIFYSLPQHPGLSTWDVIGNLLGSEDRPTHGLSVRSRRIFVDPRDVRDTDEQKWLHPRGACAEARWIITEKSVATGLFAAGTRLPAIVRLSTGDGNSDKSEAGRIFGLAVKVFPSVNPDQPVRTVNYISLDQYGFERSKRDLVFEDGPGARGPIYFTNVAPAKSALGKFLSTFFDRFDLPNFARPVYQFARVDTAGRALAQAVTPYEVRMVATNPPQMKSARYGDFRAELIEPQRRELDIVIQSFDGRAIEARKIGRLELGNFVVSDFCDLRLHFHHSPIEDQWNKYGDYEVVKDLRSFFRN